MESIINRFCEEQQELLRLELESEDSVDVNGKQDEGSRSHVIHQLQALEISVGLFGRTVVQLGQEKLLPAHRFTTGNQVSLRSKDQQATVGVVSKVTDEHISIALGSTGRTQKNQKQDSKASKKQNIVDDDDQELLGSPPYSLHSSSSVEVHKKMLHALDDLKKHGIDHEVAGKVIRTLFDAPSCPQSLLKMDPSFPTNATLDESQKEAIHFALQANPLPVTLIHGPPGTGKTTTVVELIQQAVQRHGYRVLVTAPSNVAVDNILSRLVAVEKRKRPKVVRLGHPARLHASILPYSLEALVKASDGTEIVADVRKELEQFLKLSSKSKYNSDRATARREIKVLRQEIRSREERVVADLVGNAQVVLATCVGASSSILLKNSDPFDLVVIDEAAQALEAACWIPTLKGGRLVLAGDHCQLPPTIKCNLPKVQEGLGRTMFERVMEMYHHDPRQISRILRIQYRMHQSISDWASQALYHGNLETAEHVKDRTLSTLSSYKAPDDEDETVGDTALLLIDTSGCGYHDAANAAGSRFNVQEAELVASHVEKLVCVGLPQTRIAVISPYNGQVEILKGSLLPKYPLLEIRSVDGFQGGEREAVVLSLVRSNQNRGSGIGFLRDNRRLNVAVTRAKRHCCVICDSETVSQSEFIGNLLSWIEQHGEYRSALDTKWDSSDVDDHFVSDLMRVEARLSKEVNKPKRNSRPIEQSKSQDDEFRRELLRKIRMFVKSAAPGEELALSTELSKGDRKSVHELAEELLIGHESTGVEGKDRRIILTIPAQKQASVTPDPLPMMETVAETENDVQTTSLEPTLASEELVSEAYGSVEISDGEREGKAIETDTTEAGEAPTINVSLAALAQERRQREASQNQSRPSQNMKNAPRKSKGKKLGGTKKPKSSGQAFTLDDEGLDDMAFLDAQIEKVQNSHGRVVSGKGAKYRTIVNGILISQPEAAPKKKSKASSLLQSRLREAQNSRKVKNNKKK